MYTNCIDLNTKFKKRASRYLIDNGRKNQRKRNGNHCRLGQGVYIRASFDFFLVTLKRKVIKFFFFFSFQHFKCHLQTTKKPKHKTRKSRLKRNKSKLNNNKKVVENLSLTWRVMSTAIHQSLICITQYPFNSIRLCY